MTLSNSLAISSFSPAFAVGRVSLAAPTAGRLVAGGRAEEVTLGLVNGALALAAAVVVVDELLVVRTRGAGIGGLRADEAEDGTAGFRTVVFGSTEDEVEEARRAAGLGASAGLVVPTLGGARDCRAVRIGAFAGGTAAFVLVRGLRAVVLGAGLTGAFMPK